MYRVEHNQLSIQLQLNFLALHLVHLTPPLLRYVISVSLLQRHTLVSSRKSWNYA